MESGIEAINVYGGCAYIDIRTLFKARGLDLARFDNLMMEKKSVALPCEDPVTNAVNAAKPIIDRLTDAEKNRIELVISATESGLDFGKPIATYIHEYLNLSRNCRMFEVKHACYAGTAGVQMANNFILSGVSPGAKALVIATDVARAVEKKKYTEPSQGSGAAAMLISDTPHMMEIDIGASGYYSFEVMDTCRPLPDIEVVNTDLSLMSYLDCLENCFKLYSEKVEGADFLNTFDYLVFHTPFAGMVKGAHRKMMRRLFGYDAKQIESDFQKRVRPSLTYGVQVGNTYSASLYFALCGVIDHGPITDFCRIGLFSYGSGCSSEFYSGVITPTSKSNLAEMRIQEKLLERCTLSMTDYDRIVDLYQEWMFGIKDKTVDISSFSDIYENYVEGRNLLVLKRIKDYHREYVWS